ncbi:MAG: primosomal protein N' [Bacteroides sp.]|nr:primosomal protein N' [Eubacterium sp.]MCM1417951.1 primosomal protein N' [Roseburia sp.]MCM1461802.1 primosomal protein N' [Bacteroides sp.]
MSEPIALVAVERTAASFDDLFGYRVPAPLRETARAGMRVLVPFGRGDRKRAGVIFRVEDKPDEDAAALKPIFSAAEDGIFLSGELLRLAEWLRETTFCTYYAAVRAMLPAGLSLTADEGYEIADAGAIAACTEAEKKVFSDLLTLEKARERRDFLNRPELRREVGGLLEAGVLKKKEGVKRRVGDERERTVSLGIKPDGGERLSPKQRKVLETLGEVGEVSVKELCYLASVTAAVIKRLAAKGLVEIAETEGTRAVSANATITDRLSEIVFSPTQERVYGGLLSLMRAEEARVALLHGVTGSGKTLIFVKLIEAARAADKTAILLVPEISLTPQTVSRFQSLFGSDVAIMHSSLSAGQRADEFKRIERGEAKIVIGTRSAVFAPLKNIGIVIIDEEDEHTYRSEMSPRYHARDVAKRRCRFHNALLLLASATPSFESYTNAKNGQYALFEMTERFNASALPDVRIVDMRLEAERGNRSNFSRALLDELRLNLDRGEQSMLLLNRRGYHTYVNCIACGAVAECPNCGIPLTYHKANESLLCHLCGYHRAMDHVCEKCGSRYLYQSGTGTQRIEDEIRSLFPEARVLRMDADTTMSKQSYEKRFRAFADREYDIMVGTQMIAKGLDFENVTLVGVLLIDRSLYAGDYLGYEKTFSLITQVVGRCGRGKKPGRAFLQTFTPDHYVLELAARQDYKEFYAQEIEVRRALIFPPFCDLCLIVVTAAEKGAADRAAKKLFALVKAAADKDPAIPLILLGPTEYGRVGGNERRRIVLKCRRSPALRALLRAVSDEAYRDPALRGAAFTLDFNGEIV